MAASTVKEKSSLALLLIDVINHFEFPDGARILKRAKPLSAKLAGLKNRAREAGIPVIYVNDNLGQWRSDVQKLVDYCLRPESAARGFVEAIVPGAQDYFILKPMHSAFYQTPLDVLLRHLGASEVVLAGIATNSCILCSTHDAKMRDLGVTILEDCCTAKSAREHRRTIEHIRQIQNVRILSSVSPQLFRKRKS